MGLQKMGVLTDVNSTNIVKVYTCKNIDKIRGDKMYTLENCLGNRIVVDKAGILELCKLGYMFTNLEVSAREIKANPRAREGTPESIDRTDYRITEKKEKDIGKVVEVADFCNKDSIVDVDIRGLYGAINDVLSIYNKDRVGHSLRLTSIGEEMDEAEKRLKLFHADSTIVRLNDFKALLLIAGSNSSDKAEEVTVYFTEKVRFSANREKIGYYSDRAACKSKSNYRCPNKLIIDAVDIEDVSMLGNVIQVGLDMWKLSFYVEICNLLIDCKHIYNLFPSIGNEIHLHDLYFTGCETLTGLVYGEKEFDRGTSHIGKLTIENISMPNLKSVASALRALHIVNLDIKGIDAPNVEEIYNLIDCCSISKIAYDESFLGENLKKVNRLICNSNIDDDVKLNFLNNKDRDNLKEVVKIISNSRLRLGLDISNLDLNKLDVCVQPINAIIGGEIKTGTALEKYIKDFVPSSSTANAENSNTIKNKLDTSTVLERGDRTQRSTHVLNSKVLKELYKFMKDNTDTYEIYRINTVFGSSKTVEKEGVPKNYNVDVFHFGEVPEEKIGKLTSYKACKAWVEQFMNGAITVNDIFGLKEDVSDSMHRYVLGHLSGDRNLVGITDAVKEQIEYQPKNLDYFEKDNILASCIRIKTGWKLEFKFFKNMGTYNEVINNEEENVIELTSSIRARCNIKEKRVIIEYVEFIDFSTMTLSNFRLPDGTLWFEKVDISDLTEKCLVNGAEPVRSYSSYGAMSPAICMRYSDFLNILKPQTQICEVTMNVFSNPRYNIEEVNKNEFKIEDTEAKISKSIICRDYVHSGIIYDQLNENRKSKSNKNLATVSKVIDRLITDCDSVYPCRNHRQGENSTHTIINVNFTEYEQPRSYTSINSTNSGNTETVKIIRIFGDVCYGKFDTAYSNIVVGEDWKSLTTDMLADILREHKSNTKVYNTKPLISVNGIDYSCLNSAEYKENSKY